MALSDIFMQADIFFMSAADIFIMSGCIFIILAQRLFFIIAVFDIRLHDIIMFMSASDIFMPAIDECFIESCFCALSGAAAPKAKMAEAKIMVVDFIMNLENRISIKS